MKPVCINVSPLTAGYQMRGIGTYLRTLVTALEQLAADKPVSTELRYIMFTPNPDVTHSLPDTLRPFATRVAVVPSTGQSQPGKSAASLSNMEDAIRRGGYALYHATALEDNVPSSAYHTVLTLYDLIPLHYQDWLRSIKHPDAFLRYRQNISRVSQTEHIIAISEATKQDAIETLGIPAERISVIYPTVDPSRAYIPSPEELTEAVLTLGIPGPYFFCVAASDPHKNLPRLFEAFAILRQRYPQASPYHLFIVGTWAGRTGRQVETAIAKYNLEDVVHHLIDVPGKYMPALYHGATAVVFPSLMEGFGLPVLEGMMCGAPVITSNRSSMPEIGGDAVGYIDPENAEAIAEAMASIAREPTLRKEYIARGLQRSQLFNWQRMADETFTVYQKMIGS
jgi:glycosyltransferase involved in cell wall biosynthesis